MVILALRHNSCQARKRAGHDGRLTAAVAIPAPISTADTIEPLKGFNTQNFISEMAGIESYIYSVKKKKRPAEYKELGKKGDKKGNTFRIQRSYDIERVQEIVPGFLHPRRGENREPNMTRFLLDHSRS